MYREVSTGAVFKNGTFQYRLANGDYVLTYRSRNSVGALQDSALTLRDEGGALKAVGNGYAYVASVRAWAADQRFPLQPQFDYLATGYDVGIANTVDSNGNMVFKEAIVTRPDGQTVLYYPRVGRSWMGAVQGSMTSQIQYAAITYRSETTPGDAAAKLGLFYTAGKFDDDEIRKFADQGVWTIEWVHADANKQNVRQTYRTMSRAATIGELRKTPLPAFSPSLVQQWADLQTKGGIVFGAPSPQTPNVFTVAAGDGGDAWTQTDDAIALSALTAYGNSANGTSFNDTATITSLDRKATVLCGKKSNADLHCDDAGGGFASGSRVYSIELYGRNVRQQEFTSTVAFWKVAD
jgi:hypothetical protein